jgi:hypothetical protein
MDDKSSEINKEAREINFEATHEGIQKLQVGAIFKKDYETVKRYKAPCRIFATAGRSERKPGQNLKNVEGGCATVKRKAKKQEHEMHAGEEMENAITEDKAMLGQEGSVKEDQRGGSECGAMAEGSETNS